jgi:lysozyme family protein
LLFNQLMDARLSYFKGLSDFSVFGVGWSNRLESFKQYNQKYIKKDNKMDITLVIGVLILLGLLILLYFALK